MDHKGKSEKHRQILHVFGPWKIDEKLSKMRPGVFVPTDQDLANFLGRTDLNSENLQCLLTVVKCCGKCVLSGFVQSNVGKISPLLFNVQRGVGVTFCTDLYFW